MKAIVVSQTGGPESLVLAEQPTPEPGTGQVLIEVAAAGVNFIDVYHRTGLYRLPTPFIPGLEGAGKIVALGPEVTQFAIGDAVAWTGVIGSYAEQVVASAESVVAVPSGVDLQLAAAVMLQGITAHYLSHSTYPVNQGDDVLVHAAAGGVGLLLTQMVKRRGGRVFATVSTPRKAELARGAGADEVFGYDDFTERVRDSTGGAGVHVVYDGVGATTFDGSLASLRPRGMQVLYGQSSGVVPPVDPQVLSQGGSLYLTRPTSTHYVADRAELLSRVGDLFGWIASGELDVHVGGRYPLESAAVAHTDLEARHTTGKLLLVP